MASKLDGVLGKCSSWTMGSHEKTTVLRSVRPHLNGEVLKVMNQTIIVYCQQCTPKLSMTKKQDMISWPFRGQKDKY